VYLLCPQLIFLSIDNYLMLHEFLHLKKQRENLLNRKISMYHFLLRYLLNATDLFQYQVFHLMLLIQLLNPLFEQQEENSQLLMEFVDTKY
jgi:hypothetical protein